MRDSLTARPRLFPLVRAATLAASTLAVSPALAEYRTKDVPAVTGLDPAGIAPNTIAFTDHRDNPASPESGSFPSPNGASAARPRRRCSRRIRPMPNRTTSRR